MVCLRTFAYSTIEIGHRTLDPPALNRKSVLIPIVQKGKSTLSITYKCRQSAACRLFFYLFEDRNALCGSHLRIASSHSSLLFECYRMDRF